MTYQRGGGGAGGAPAGASVAVKDEGSAVVATASAIDFVGAGVTATDGGSGTATVTINGVGVTDEQVQDIVGAFVTAGANITVTYDDTGNTLTIAVSGLTESVQDIVGAFLTAGTGITATYDDAGNLETISVKPGLNLTRTAVKTGNYTAAVGDLVPCDTSGGAFTVTLPTAPADRTTIGVKLVVAGSALTIVRGGSDVFNKASGATSLTLNYANQSVVMQYDSATAIWTVVAVDLPLSATQYELVQALGNSGTAKTIDAVSGTYVTTTLTGNVTFTFPSPTSGQAYSFTLETTQDGTGSRTITWPASVKWPGGTAPTVTATAAAVDIYAFVTRDGGTTWRGVQAEKDSK